MLIDVILNVVACSLVVYQQYLKFNMSRMNASSFLHKHIYVSLLAILGKKIKSILMQSFHYFQILSTTKFYRSFLPLNVTRHKRFCMSLPLFRLACWAPFPKSYNPSLSNYPQCTVYVSHRNGDSYTNICHSSPLGKFSVSSPLRTIDSAPFGMEFKDP